MPAGGHAARGRMLGTIAGIKHQRLTSPELVELVDRCAQEAAGDALGGAEVREARRRVERARRIPGELARDLAAARSAALEGWQRSRAEDDFAPLCPALAHLFELKRQEADACTDGALYDGLLAEYEPATTAEQLDEVFADLQRGLVQVLAAVQDSGQTISEAAACGTFDPDKQLHFCRWLAETLGFRSDRGRIDRSAHPFCVGLTRDDVRFTWRADPGDLRPAILGTLHEAGHALYEQGIPAELEGTPLGCAASLGIHESQSRLWENHVGRSRGFWCGILPHWLDAFPDTPARSADALWPALHAVVPSLVRTEADQTTYALHIVARYRLERALLDGSLPIADLPAAWAAEYRELLGISPGSAREGVLQDIHWPLGLVGYFPTYAIGSLACAQLYETALRELGDLEAAFAELDFAPLLEWLRDRVHRHGARYQTQELVERVTGQPLSADAFLRHLGAHAEALYGATIAFPVPS